jgi:virulence-associated protein VagC
MKKERVLKRVLNVCQSRAVILPKEWATDLPDFVWLIKENGKITIQPAEVS